MPFRSINPASVLFIGLSVTFGVLGLLSTYLGQNLRWAYIPGSDSTRVGIGRSDALCGIAGVAVAAGADRCGRVSDPAPPDNLCCTLTAAQPQPHEIARATAGRGKRRYKYRSK
jgi:hypothetical protein